MPVTSPLRGEPRSQKLHEPPPFPASSPLSWASLLPLTRSRSPRRAGMATSTRPSRKAAKAVNYAYGDPLSSDEERGGAAPASSDEGDDDDGETYGSKAKVRGACAHSALLGIHRS